jgi:hypothetical protein
MILETAVDAHLQAHRLEPTELSPAPQLTKTA